MPRANRYFLPGYVWHITHRCHKREFLLKFDKDKQNWKKWLFQAKKRYGLQILNYTITSNHIHLLVFSDKHSNVIPYSIQLAAGRTAQEFNQRKKRRGAFWEDRYHATVVDTDTYFLRCMLYIDLNMVRAGVVAHPRDWSFTGFHEIVSPPERYRLIDREKLLELLCGKDETTLTQDYCSWIDEAIGAEVKRNPDWTESIAVGTRTFVDNIEEQLGSRATGRSIIDKGVNGSVLREEPKPYNPLFEAEKGALSQENSYFWNISQGI
jgi:REP element-mobilizing transposase RayT